MGRRAFPAHREFKELQHLRGFRKAFGGARVRLLDPYTQNDFEDEYPYGGTPRGFGIMIGPVRESEAPHFSRAV